jgi:hypothetical protein
VYRVAQQLTWMFTYHSRPAFVTPQPLTRQGPEPSDEPEAIEQEQDKNFLFCWRDLDWKWLADFGLECEEGGKNKETIVLFLKHQFMLPCHDD